MSAGTLYVDPEKLKRETKWKKRIVRTMEKEMICSEHGAACFLEACRREKKRPAAQEQGEKK